MTTSLKPYRMVVVYYNCHPATNTPYRAAAKLYECEDFAYSAAKLSERRKSHKKKRDNTNRNKSGKPKSCSTSCRSRTTKKHERKRREYWRRIFAKPSKKATPPRNSV